MMDVKAQVRRTYPGAVAEYAELELINCKGWFILRNAGCPMVGWPWMVGSGRTEDEAWAHALSLITTSEGAMCG